MQVGCLAYYINFPTKYSWGTCMSSAGVTGVPCTGVHKAVISVLFSTS
jgi:hypothetical protein